MSRHLTAGLDGSRESVAAALWAAREASLLGCSLRLLHVWDLVPETYPVLAGADARRLWAERAEFDPREVVRRIRADHPRLSVETGQSCGDPVRELCEAAEEAEVLVVGSRGLGAFSGFVVGSVSLSVVARSRRPVVLVRAAPAGAEGAAGAASGAPDGRVVVGVDATRPVDEVLEYAFTHAERHGAAVQAVYAWALPTVWTPEQAAAAYALRDELAGVQQALVEEALEPWRRKFPEVAATAVAVPGRSAAELPAAAEGAGLVVVGRRDRAARLGTHIGSVTHAVLHHCAAPVAVVPHV
ncbi:universal stress protein [Streptomyces sp. NPDC047097]|uniref:universal stress protein n=1 Tax=Streptomyces sp. NPDC047097 TaxID=3155260 RepID=UPI0033CA69BC